MGLFDEPKTFNIEYGDISHIVYKNNMVDPTKVEITLRNVSIKSGIIVGELFWYILPHSNIRTIATVVEIKGFKISEKNKDMYDAINIIASIVRTASLNKIPEIDTFHMCDTYEYDTMCALFFEGNLDKMFVLEMGKPVTLTKDAEDKLISKYGWFLLNGAQYNLCVKNMMPEGSRIIMDVFVDTFETEGNGYRYHVKKMCIYGYRYGLPIPSNRIFNDIRIHARSIGKV